MISSACEEGTLFFIGKETEVWRGEENQTKMKQLAIGTIYLVVTVLTGNGQLNF